MKRHILWTVSVASLTLASCGGVLLFTERGLRWSLDTLHTLSARHITVRQAEGRWWGPLQLRGIALHTESTSIDIKELKLDWEPPALSERTVHLKRLELSGVSINKLIVTEDIDPIVPPHWPITIRLDHAVLRELRFARKGQPAFALSGAELRALIYQPDRLSVASLALRHALGEVNLIGTLRLDQRTDTALQAHWQIALPGVTLPLRGRSDITGNFADLSSGHRVTGPLTADVQAHLDLLHTNLPWRASATLEPLALRRLLARLPAAVIAGRLRGDGDMRRWRFNSQLMLDEPRLGQWRANLSGHHKGEDWVLDRALLAAASHPARIRTSALWQANNRKWTVDAQVDQLQATALNPQWPPVLASGQFKALGDPAHTRLNGKGVIDSVALGRWQAHLNLNRSGDDWLLSNLSLRALDHAGRLDLHASWEGTPTLTTPIKLQGSWRDLGWPLAQPTTASPRGELAVSGRLDRYDLASRFELVTGTWPTSTWRLDGQGNRTAVDLQATGSDVLDANWSARGQLTWQPRINWTGSVQAAHVNLGTRWPAWPSALNLTANLSGAVVDGQPHAQIQLSRLQGTVRDRPVQANAEVSAEGTRITLSQLGARVGHTHVSGHGTLERDGIDAQWALTTPDVSDLLPGATGYLSAQGRIAGQVGSPQLQAQLRGRQLQYGAQHIARLEGEVSAELGTANPQAHISLTASDTRLGALTLGTASLEAKGTPDNHRAVLNARADSGERLQLGLSGSWQASRWKAQLEHGALSTTRLGNWKAEPSQLVATARQLSLQPWCWRSGASSACMAATPRDTDNWDGQLTLEGLDLALVRPWLPEGPLSFSGTVEGTARASFTGLQALTAEATAQARDGAFNFPVSKDKWHSSRYRILSASLLAAPGNIQLDSRLDLGTDGEINLVAKLPDWDPTHGRRSDHPLEGSIQGTLHNLNLVQEWVPDLAQPQGTLLADLAVGGRLGAPTFGGKAHLLGGNARIPRLGLTLQDIDIHLDGPPGAPITLKASTRSGPGRLDISGRLTPHTLADWDIELDGQGEDLEVAQLPQARILAAPDLSYRSNGRERRLDGSITIPQAYIVLPEKETSLAGSPDVVITDAPAAAPIERGKPLHYRVRVTLGELVSLRGYGFKGRLNGSLVTEDNPATGDIAYGELAILDGEYKAYGQKLKVEKGRLLFPGGPLDNPGISARAIRSDLDRTVIAGVQVSGFLRTPEVKLFSTPTMDDSDILAYLLLGRPLKLASAAEGQMMYQAASGLSLAGSELIAGRIAERFAIDELRIQTTTGTSAMTGSQAGAGVRTITGTQAARATTSATEQTSLVLGKYLSPRLYVRYAYGIGQTPSLLYLRYQLSNRWTLETAGGDQIGTDLRYTIEH